MTRVPPNLPPSLLKLNPHLAPVAKARTNALDTQRLAACPPSQQERLTGTAVHEARGWTTVRAALEALR